MEKDKIADEKIAYIKALLDDELYKSKKQGKNHSQIITILVELFEMIYRSYDGGLQITNSLFSMLEKYHELSVAHLFSMFQSNITFLKNIEVIPYEEPAWKFDSYDNSTWMNIREEFVLIKKEIAYSRQSMDSISNSLTFPHIVPNKRHLHFILYSIDQCLNTIDCVPNNLAEIIHDLCIFRNTLQSTQKQELYLLVANITQTLDQTQHFQLSLRLSRDGLHASYKDDCKELGYYLMAGHSTRANKTLKSLLYLDLCLFHFNKTKVVSNPILQAIYWISFIFCRNNRYIEFAKQIFNQVSLENESFSTRNRFYTPYFNMLANTYEKNLPNLIFEFIEQNKDELINQRVGIILPWFALLLRIKSEIKEFIINNPEKLEDYIKVFEGLLPKSVAENHYNILFGSIQDMENNLVKAFQGLSFSKDRIDFISENKYAIALANVLIKKSRKETDLNGYWLAMVIKSDITLVFNNKEQYLNASSPNTPFWKKQYEFLKSLVDINILWLGSDGVNIYPLNLTENKITWIENELFTVSTLESFYETVVKKLSFDYQLYYSSDLYSKQNKDLFAALNFSLFPAFINKEIFIIKDMLISSFPHNLIVDPSGFLILMYPITNIISIEWLLEKLNIRIKHVYTISMWIPLGAILFDEFTEINSKMEEVVTRHKIVLENGVLPKIPLASAINIVIAHGNDAITSFPAFQFKEGGQPTSTSELDVIIGAGKVLVLFVCYGGLTKMDSYRGQVSSLTTRYLREGYDAVIAPFWPLSTAIPPIWLPIFLNKLKNGSEISKAVWHANITVKEKFDSPNAYACMHLYGNPFFR